MSKSALACTALALLATTGCTTASGVVAARLDADRASLSKQWAVVQGSNGDVQVGEYVAANVGPRQSEELPAYGFTVLHGAGAMWEVYGTGRLSIRGEKVAVQEHVEFSAGPQAEPWLLDLESADTFQLVGNLRGVGERYEVRAVASGSLPTGEEYGADAICFLKGDHVEAAVEFGPKDSALVRVRAGLDPHHESLLAAAVTAITLRRHNLRATGARPRVHHAVGLGDTPCPTNMNCFRKDVDEDRLLKGASGTTRRNRNVPAGY